MKIAVIRQIIEFMVKNLYGKNILAQFSKNKLYNIILPIFLPFMDVLTPINPQ